MALTRTELGKVSPKNPTIFTRTKVLIAKAGEVIARHQALYPGSMVHLCFMAVLIAISAILEAIGRTSFGWYLLCCMMNIGYWFDLKDQRLKHRPEKKQTSGPEDDYESGN